MREGITPIVTDLAFPEGLRWRHGELWYSDMHVGEIHSWAPTTGDRTVHTLTGAVSGLGWTPNGELLAVSMDDRRLLRFGADGAPVTMADLAQFTPSPINDMVVDDGGVAYIGSFGFDLHGGADFGTGAVLQVRPDGSTEIAASDLSFPNGMVITDNGSTLVVAETLAARLTAFTIGADASLSDPRVWASLPSDMFPDGICLDTGGGIWLASTTTAECALVLEGGEIADRVSCNGASAFACALGGEDGRTLFIATSDHLAPQEARSHRSGRIQAVDLGA